MNHLWKFGIILILVALWFTPVTDLPKSNHGELLVHSGSENHRDCSCHLRIQ